MGQVIPLATVCYENLRLPHQIVIRADRSSGWLYVSCTCLHTGNGWTRLASGLCLPADDAYRAWLSHMTTIRENDHDDRDPADDRQQADPELREVQQLTEPPAYQAEAGSGPQAAAQAQQGDARLP